jgi:hypothetical protein
MTGLMAGCILYSASIFLFENLWEQREDQEMVSTIRFSSDSFQASNSRPDTQQNADSDWKLILVNRWHEIPEGYQPELTRL